MDTRKYDDIIKMDLRERECAVLTDVFFLLCYVHKDSNEYPTNTTLVSQSPKFSGMFRLKMA